VTVSLEMRGRPAGTLLEFPGQPEVAAMKYLVSMLLLMLVCTAPDANAAEGRNLEFEPVEPSAVSTASARKLVSAFAATLKSARKEELTLRRRKLELAGLRALAAGRHERVAKCLVETVATGDVLVETRIAALRAFPLQGKGAVRHVSRLDKWLRGESRKDAEDIRGGRIGVPVDRRTGDPVTDTPAARRALREGEARARLLAAGIATLREMKHEPKKAASLLLPFLQSPYDELAVAAVEAAQSWEARELACELAVLLRMYPRAHRWETGAVTHLGGTNASAKAEWMRLFGHPLKQRARPAVHRAVVACASAWAGSKVADARALEAWIAKQRG
jgi:hypothetical protein